MERFRMSEILPSIVYQLGLGGIGGFVIGYALKKISKFLLILMGLLLIFLLYLGTRGVIDINYVKLEEAVMDFIGGAGQAASSRPCNGQRFGRNAQDQRCLQDPDGVLPELPLRFQ